MPRGPKKADREKIKELIYQGLTDKQVGEIVNRSFNTIKQIRQQELKIHKHGNLYFGKKWRSPFWIKTKGKTKSMFLTIPIKYTRKMGFIDREPLKFKIIYQEPKKLLIEFRRKEDV